MKNDDSTTPGDDSSEDSRYKVVDAVSVLKESNKLIRISKNDSVTLATENQLLESGVFDPEIVPDLLAKIKYKLRGCKLQIVKMVDTVFGEMIYFKGPKGNIGVLATFFIFIPEEI